MSPGTWKRIGFIERAKAEKGLLIHARAFGKDVTGIIPPEGIRRLTSPGSSPAEILDTHPGREGEKIGKAYRSRSGRGIIVSLIAAPECSGSWQGFRDLLDGIREGVVLSVFEETPSFREPVRPPLDHGSLDLDLREGLECRFG